MRVLLALFLSLALCAPAQAQINGSRFKKYADEGDAARVMENFARCFAGQKLAHEFMDTLPTSPGENDVIQRYYGYGEPCLNSPWLRMEGRMLKFETPLLRGELARVLLNEVLRDESHRYAPGNGMAWLAARVDAAKGYDRPTLIAHQFAACLADEHFDQSTKFALADRGSKEESAALRSLAPFFASCLAEGATLSVDGPTLKFYVAEAAYHNLTYTPEGAE